MRSSTATVQSPEADVRRCSDAHLPSLSQLMARYGMSVNVVNDQHPIPGSHFGEPEAGLIKNLLYVRGDTPLHSALHEACHYICMDEQRRTQLHTDAGGGYDEENAVCYLSILLADHLDDFDRHRMMSDMDQWGYSFRLGSARQWFYHDAEDARQYLIEHKIIFENSQPSWQLGANHE